MQILNLVATSTILLRIANFLCESIVFSRFSKVSRSAYLACVIFERDVNNEERIRMFLKDRDDYCLFRAMHPRIAKKKPEFSRLCDYREKTGYQPNHIRHYVLVRRKKKELKQVDTQKIIPRKDKEGKLICGEENSNERDWFENYLEQALETQDNVYKRYPRTAGFLYIRWIAHISSQGKADRVESPYETPPESLDRFNMIPKLKDRLVCTRNHTRKRRREAM